MATGISSTTGEGSRRIISSGAEAPIDASELVKVIIRSGKELDCRSELPPGCAFARPRSPSDEEWEDFSTNSISPAFISPSEEMVLMQDIDILQKRRDEIEERIQPQKNEIALLQKQILALHSVLKEFDGLRKEVIGEISTSKEMGEDAERWYDEIDTIEKDRKKCYEECVISENQRAFLEDSIYKEVSEIGALDGKLFSLRKKLELLIESGKTA